MSNELSSPSLSAAGNQPRTFFNTLGLEELLTVEEVAIYTRTSKQVVWREIRSRRLQARRFGRGLRVPVSALHDWLGAGN